MAPKKKPVGKQETEEERAARLEARAIAEKEAAIMREEAACQKLLERQKHEQALTRLNAPKVHTEWRQRMRNAKLEELMSEANRLRDAHTRAMQGRNHELQALDAALQEAEEQQLKAHRAHARTIDRLVETQTGRLDAALQQYEYHRETMVQDYEQQIAVISKSFKAAEAENEAARDEVQRHYAQQEAEQLLAFQTARAEAGEAASEEYNMLKLSREAQIATLKKVLKEEEHRHRQATANMAREVQDLQRKDAEGHERMAKNLIAIADLQKEVAHWRSRAALADRECAARHQSLTSERADLQKQHHEMERSLEAFCKDQAAALERLCMVSAAKEAELTKQLQEAAQRVRALKLVS